MLDNSNVLEYNFTLNDFLKGFFTDFETQPTNDTSVAETPYYKKYFYNYIVTSDEIHYYTAMSYKAPIITLPQAYGNFEDEYKYIYIQTPDFTDFIYNSWSPYSTGTNIYASYMTQSLTMPTPIFRINNSRACELVNESAGDIFRLHNGNNRVIWSYFKTNNNSSALRSNINLIPSNILKANMMINNNHTFIIPYSMRNKKELYIQLDTGNNAFGLLLNSMKPDLNFNTYTNYSKNSSFETFKDILITNNAVGFQNNLAFTESTCQQAIQTNIMDIMKKPIQVLISKEKLF